MGGPDEDHLRRLVAKLVHEEVEKILREKQGGQAFQPPAERARPQGQPHHDGRPEPRR